MTGTHTHPPYVMTMSGRRRHLARNAIRTWCNRTVGAFIGASTPPRWDTLPVCGLCATAVARTEGTP